MGLKSLLIYFEVVTTFALLIGWGAITLTQAGAGITLPARVDNAQIQTPVDRTWQTIVLDIFPEILAKSVAENQVLQVVAARGAVRLRAGGCCLSRRSAADAVVRREPGGDDVRVHAGW